MRETTTESLGRIRAETENIAEATEQELGYIKSILSAIELMARTDARHHVSEIADLAKCAHWIADNLESNVDHFGAKIIEASREVSHG